MTVVERHDNIQEHLVYRFVVIDWYSFFRFDESEKCVYPVSRVETTVVTEPCKNLDQIPGGKLPIVVHAKQRVFWPTIQVYRYCFFRPATQYREILRQQNPLDDLRASEVHIIIQEHIHELRLYLFLRTLL